MGKERKGERNGGGRGRWCTAYLTSPAPDILCPLGKQRLVGTEVEFVGGPGWWGGEGARSSRNGMF